MAEREASKKLAYLTTTNDPIPADHVVIHNKVMPSNSVRLGMRGFRAWHQALDDTVVECQCGWAPRFGVHYIPKAVVDTCPWATDPHWLNANKRALLAR